MLAECIHFHTLSANFTKWSNTLSVFDHFVGLALKGLRALFLTNPIAEVPLAEKLKLFYSDCVKLTQDPNILNIAQGFEIPFLENLSRENHQTDQF